MKRPQKTIFFVAALILIPVFIGLIPLNLDQKLASGAPLAPAKHLLRCSPCLFHSITSHAEPAIIDTVQVVFTPEPLVCPASVTAVTEALPSVLPDIPPLRC